MVAMINILALETSGNTCSVGLNCGGEVLQIVEEGARQHARKVLPMIDALLAQANVSLGQLDAISFSRGPGSFTGLRIGFGIVQGLAYGADLPVIGVSTLQCMAFKAARQVNTSSVTVMPALDARMKEVYFGVYRAGNNEVPDVVYPDSVMTPLDASAIAAVESVDLAVGEGWNLLPGETMPIGALIPAFSADAENLALIAHKLFMDGICQDIFSAELSYIRNEVSWKKRTRVRSV